MYINKLWLLNLNQMLNTFNDSIFHQCRAGYIFCMNDESSLQYLCGTSQFQTSEFQTSEFSKHIHQTLTISKLR